MVWGQMSFFFSLNARNWPRETFPRNSLQLLCTGGDARRRQSFSRETSPRMWPEGQMVTRQGRGFATKAPPTTQIHHPLPPAPRAFFTYILGLGDRAVLVSKGED